MSQKSSNLRFNENGSFSPREWLQESNSQYISSKILRDAGSKIFQDFNSSEHTEDHGILVQVIHEKESAYKSSILLIGYAIELALKAGVLSFYKGLPKTIIESEIKHSYGHDLNKIAQDLSLNISISEKKLLKLVRDFVIEKARYPLNPISEPNYIKRFNENKAKIQSEKTFTDLVNLYEKIYNFAQSIDNDTDNPASTWEVPIDDDGYIVLRIGGNLPSRLTVKYSSHQIINNEDNLDDLNDIINKNVDGIALFKLAQTYWSELEIYEHKTKSFLKKRT